MRTTLRGYDPAEVDRFLARCLVTLGGRADFPELAGLNVASALPVTREEVQNVQFPVRFRGYSLEEVDRLLDRVAEALLST